MKTLFYHTLLVLICFGCSKEKKAVSVQHKDSVSHKVVQPDTKILKDSTYTFRGEPYIVNGIKCYWEGMVFRNAATRTERPYSLVTYYRLKSYATGNVLIDLGEGTELGYYGGRQTDELIKKKLFQLDCEDVNLDGDCDFKIVMQNGTAGQLSATYLFNNSNKKFEYSELFSGLNVEYDTEKNRISDFFDTGHYEYFYGYDNLKSNRRDVAFTEGIRLTQDSIIYSKHIGKRLVKETKIKLKEKEIDLGSVDFEYLLERN
jgi:hypothetical protein